MAQTVLQTLLAVAAIILLARINGLRSFSKMSSFDFALTIASGSVLATLMTTSDNFWPGFAALVALFAARYVISALRVRSGRLVEKMVDNRPIILMHEGRILDDNLRLARVTRADIRAKLREANALEPDRVRAVVMEATGDVSVLHGDRFDPSLLEGVSWGRVTPPAETART